MTQINLNLNLEEIEAAILESNMVDIRRFFAILEHHWGLLEHPPHIFEHREHLLEDRTYILEDRSFIRTFLNLLEHF